MKNPSKKDLYTSIDKCKNMKIPIILFAISLLSVSAAVAQQDAQYTQFMFNKLALNPGYAGNYEATSVTALQRNQWTGFKGAPSSQSMTLNTSLLKNKIGLGVVILHDKIGATDSWNIGAAYAYKVKLAKGLLSETDALNQLGRAKSYDYNAWWFCSFHVEAVRKVGLPLPLFIHGNDIEYGMRLKEHGYPVYCPGGISLWHQSFENKRLTWIRYRVLFDTEQQNGTDAGSLDRSTLQRIDKRSGWS